jgi:rRNA maturation RNase YbeY
MIKFFSENEFRLKREKDLKKWISMVISSEGFEEGDISFVFCSDAYLAKINLEFLKHDTLTDIISFDYSLDKLLEGEIYISTERVADNAKDLEASFVNELLRVVVHGILHMCGYNDKKEEDKNIMRSREDHWLRQYETT